VDWDRQRAKQTFTLWSEDGTVLDKRDVGKLQGGCYLTWLVRGRVRITVDHQGGPNAVVSGAFLDPASPAGSIKGVAAALGPVGLETRSSSVGRTLAGIWQK
jgi:hypothetical protein